MDLAKRSLLCVLTALFGTVLFAGGVAWADEGGYAVGASSALTAQESDTLYFEYSDPTAPLADPKVTVSGRTSGSATYDAAAKTLTITDLQAEYIRIHDLSVTVNIVGENAAFLGATDAGCNLTLVGTGSLAGPVACSEVVTIDGPSVTCSQFECGSLLMKGGSLTMEGDYVNLQYRDTLSVSGGKIKTPLGRSGEAWCSNSEGAFSMTGGAVEACVITNSATISKGAFEGTLECKGALSISGGTAKGTVTSEKSLTMTGGTLTNPDKELPCALNNVKMSGGTLKGMFSGNKVVMSGGMLVGKFNSCRTFDISGKAAVKGEVYCDKFTMKGGSIKTVKGDAAVHCSGAFTMSGGKITAKKCYQGLELGSGNGKKAAKARITGGTVNIVSPQSSGIGSTDVILTISGGTVSVTKAGDFGLRMSCTEYGKGAKGGILNLKGGELTATVKNPDSYEAVYARSMTNKSSCLKKINGRLPTGAKFKAGGNEYRVESLNYPNCVVLAKYGAKATDVWFGDVKFGGVNYGIGGVGARAFNTPTGAKVRSIEFTDMLRILDANAFAGTKSLSTMVIHTMHLNNKYADAGSRLVSIAWAKEASVAKKAFAGCGKDGGKGLTVRIEYMYGPASMYQSFLRSYGLPKGAEVAKLHD